MSTTLATPPKASTNNDVETTLATLERDGFAVLKSVIPQDKVAGVRQSVGDCVRKNSSLPPPQGYCTGFLRMNQAIAPYITEPRLMAIIERLFGDYFRISHVTGTINAPGIKRANMHADWPYNQDAKAHIRAPYPDVLMNMVTMWMLTDYTIENGGTIVIPGSHKRHEAPRKGTKLDPMATYPGEVQLQGKAGDVGLFDARTWHAIAPNISKEERIGVIIRFTPWWLNLQPSRPGSRDRLQMVEANNGGDSKVEALPLAAYNTLPEDVKPLVFHLLEEKADVPAPLKIKS